VSAAVEDVSRNLEHRLRGTFVDDLVARVHALATGTPSRTSRNSSTFAAAEARARVMSRSLPPRFSDRADGAVVFASDALVSLAIESGPVGLVGAERLVDAVAALSGLSHDAAAFSLYVRAIGNPQILQLPPRIGIEVHLCLLTALAPISDVSVWLEQPPGSFQAVAAVGAAAATRRFRTVAAATIAGSSPPAAGDGRVQIHGVPVIRWERAVAALVARSQPGDRDRASVFLLECQAMLSLVLEREVLLDRSTAREQKLQSANERRLVRVGFDLHDGPLQDIAALASDLRHVRDQVAAALGGNLRTVMLGRFDDLGGRLADIDQTLRELSHSLESTSAIDRPLGEILQRELNAFERKTGIGVVLTTAGSFDYLTASQRIAIFRIVQEALSNVREHAAASAVSVTVKQLSDGIHIGIADDGVGFDIGQTLLAAARRGRLGVVGMNERVRLLGGAFSLRSAPGAGTQVTVNLPRWEPVGLDWSAPSALGTL
jgi:signal transduction histidine kinase